MMNLTLGEKFSLFMSISIVMVFVWLFIDTIYELYHLEPLTRKTIGIVSKVDPYDASYINKDYYCSFKSADGVEYQTCWKTIVKHKKPYYRVGARVEILYSPLQPTKARINRYEHLYHEYFLLFLSFIVISFGSVLFILFFKKKQETTGNEKQQK